MEGSRFECYFLSRKYAENYNYLINPHNERKEDMEAISKPYLT